MDTVQTMVELETGLNERLKALAKLNRRSKRQEILVAIEKYVELGGNVGSNTTIWSPNTTYPYPGTTWSGGVTTSIRPIPTAQSDPPGDDAA